MGLTSESQLRRPTLHWVSFILQYSGSSPKTAPPLLPRATGIKVISFFLQNIRKRSTSILSLLSWKFFSSIWGGSLKRNPISTDALTAFPQGRRLLRAQARCSRAVNTMPERNCSYSGHYFLVSLSDINEICWTSQSRSGLMITKIMMMMMCLSGT